MIRFDLQPEPATFDQDVRQPGKTWLAAHPEQKNFPDYWTKCSDDLAAAFRDLCAYTAMYIEDGTTDHYLSKNVDGNRHLVYEWSNYRYACRRVNGAKGNYDDKILDPFEVKDDGWFEVLLPSLQLVRTDRVPAELQAKVDFTLQQLRLVNHRKIINRRKKFLRLYNEGKLTLNGLRELAPLVAAAVERQVNQPADSE